MSSVKSKKGFTLIELLVVISIIGLLSSIVMSSLSDAKAKARDARRAEDIKQILIAINMYMNDHNGTVPPPNMSLLSGATRSTFSTFLDTLWPKYIPEKPNDPTNNSIYFYFYRNDETASNIITQNCGPGFKAFLRYKPEIFKTSTQDCKMTSLAGWKCYCS